MKKRWAFLMAMVMAGTLAACSASGETAQTQPAAGAEQNESQAQTEQEEGETVSTVIWTDSTQLEEGLKAAVDGFMEENPQVQISIESFPGSERPQKLALAKQGNTLPSLFLCAYFTSADEIHQGTILPLTDVVERDG